MMLSCQGVASGTANSQLFGFPAARRSGYPARSSICLKPAFLKLQPPSLGYDKKVLPLRGTELFLMHSLLKHNAVTVLLSSWAFLEGVFLFHNKNLCYIHMHSYIYLSVE
jgi:hypothetical protein